jgi:hypothetical protein
VTGAEAVDWEDIAVGPGPDADQPALYLGDVGDNDAERPTVVVYRAVEPASPPDGSGGALDLLDATTIRYPDGPADVEALLVDPVSGDLLMVTKSFAGASRLLRVPQGLLGRDGVVDAEELGPVPVPVDLATAVSGGAAVTGGDVTSDGSVVVLRTYRTVLAYARPPDGDLADALATDPCVAPEQPEEQGEAIAFSRSGDAYLTISEGGGAAVHRFAIEPLPAPDVTTTTAAAARTDGGSGSSSTALAAVAVGLSIAGLVVVLVVTRRRRRPVP